MYENLKFAIAVLEIILNMAIIIILVRRKKS